MLLLLYAIIGIIVVVVVGIIIVVYNTLISLRNNANKAMADIDVLLEKRHDALEKLIDAVKGYMSYEKGLQTQITQLRSSWMNMKSSNDTQSKIDASNQITSAFKSIMAVAENYPDLKADSSVVQLQNSIMELESQIADRREFYNQSVTNLNIKMQQVPYNAFAGMMHFTKMPLFNVPDDEKSDVKVDFGN